MEKNRLEAFSDGVFAIVITLLILDIRIPEVDYAHLRAALHQAMPRIYAYVMSFVIIGLYWISHHNSFLAVRKADRVFLWLNILLLLFVSFIPFPTSLLGRYPFQPLPIMLYGASLIACNAIGALMMFYVKFHPHLAVADFEEKHFKRQWPIYLVVNSLYLLAILIAPVAPGASYGIYAVVVLCLVVFVTGWNSKTHA